jgi:hypothetical protein
MQKFKFLTFSSHLYIAMWFIIHRTYISTCVILTFSLYLPMSTNTIIANYMSPKHHKSCQQFMGRTRIIGQQLQYFFDRQCELMCTIYILAFIVKAFVLNLIEMFARWEFVMIVHQLCKVPIKTITTWFLTNINHVLTVLYLHLGR